MTEPASSSEPATPIRILIIEDHLLVSEAIESALSAERDMEVIACVTTGAKAMDVLHHQRADVVLIDFQLPESDGLVAAKEILARHVGVNIVMVTGNEDRSLVTQALEAGCVGFIGKSESLAHLPVAIRSAASGTTAISPGIALKLARGTNAGRLGTELGERELEVLRLLAQGLSSAEISKRLFLSTHTVRNYLNRINSRLDTHSKLEAVSKALRLGLIEVERDDANNAT
jgi:DNA-binding NarL/FixJ family response regulator